MSLSEVLWHTGSLATGIHSILVVECSEALLQIGPLLCRGRGGVLETVPVRTAITPLLRHTLSDMIYCLSLVLFYPRGIYMHVLF